QFLIEQVKTAYELKITHEDPALLDHLERHIILVAIDRLWQEHLYNMDALRDGVHLRAQGQKDPLVEYKNEAYKLFVTLMDNIEGEVLGNLFRSTTNLEKFEKFLHDLPFELSGQDYPGAAVG
ncbi:MAG: preprotein translocase subunit SecA, partial [Akkermansiaceae bacterium]|nr:preprotein translocase subunit SecA [Akkermansiaceae bacterium]